MYWNILSHSLAALIPEASATKGPQNKREKNFSELWHPLFRPYFSRQFTQFLPSVIRYIALSFSNCCTGLAIVICIFLLYIFHMLLFACFLNVIFYELFWRPVGTCCSGNPSASQIATEHTLSRLLCTRLEVWFLRGRVSLRKVHTLNDLKKSTIIIMFAPGATQMKTGWLWLVYFNKQIVCTSFY